MIKNTIMRCPKDMAITIGLLMTVLLTISGILVSNSYHQVDATQQIKIDYDTRYKELKTDLHDDITEMKQDIKEIKQDIKDLNK